MSDAPPPDVRPVSSSLLWSGYLGLVMMVLFLVFAVPRFADVFKAVNVELPKVTQLAMSASHLLTDFPALSVCSLGAIGVLFFFMQGKITSRLPVLLFVGSVWLANVLLILAVYLPYASLVQAIGSNPP